MIDTDKYEGHTPAPWKAGGYNEQAIRVWTVDGFDEDDNWIQIPTADRLLALDAPLLLEEVERLREERKQIRELLAEVLPRKDGVQHMGTVLWGLESELKSTTSEIAIILGMVECEEE